MPPPRAAATMPCMTPNYAVVWHTKGEPRHVGKLEVEPHELRLSGAIPGGARSTVSIPRGTVAQVDLARSWHDRLAGRPTVIIGTIGGQMVQIASLDGPGTVHEILRLIAPTPAAA